MLKSINRYIYGPTPEERLKEWDRKLRTEQRQLDKEIRQVSSAIALQRHCLCCRCTNGWLYGIPFFSARSRYNKSETVIESFGEEE